MNHFYSSKANTSYPDSVHGVIYFPWAQRSLGLVFIEDQRASFDAGPFLLYGELE